MDKLSLIQSYLKKKKVSVTTLVKQMGISRNTFYYQLGNDLPDIDKDFIKNFNNSTNGDFIKIINTDDESSAFEDSEKKITNGYKRPLEAKPIYQDVIEVPIIEKRARAGYVRGYADPEYMETLRKVFVAKQYEKGNYLVFEIDGNSMDDDSKKSICNGDAVLCKELDKFYWQKKLFQRVFIIITDEEVLCKQIIAHNVETGLITCHSFNQAYEDFELNLSEVNQLFYLVRIVERNIEF